MNYELRKMNPLESVSALVKQMPNDLNELEERLQLEFNDKKLLDRALTHRSYLNENPDVTQDNERLEFLGDAVLDFVVGDYLFHQLPDGAEGELTALRAALVRAPTLAKFADELEIGRFLRLGLGEDESGGRQRVPLLCATFEAVVGAIYLDQGLPAAQQFIERLIAPALIEIQTQSLHKDAKSEFQVWAQAQFNITPRYRVSAVSGPDHARRFTVQVLIGDKVWGEGQGSSKQSAAQVAARVALAQTEN
jgi:ribonuclease III